MNFIDICSGIGGFRTGLERNGHNCVAFAEIDKHAIQSYKTIYNTENEVELNDITTITDEQFRSFRGQCDIITGGFPCQSFSMAGNRRGFDDTRGTIFFHIARAIKEIQPSYVLLENVKGLLSHDKGRTFGTIIQALDELGYIVEWGVFNSKYWGVPQNRERVYILVTRKDVYDQPKLFDLLKQQTEVTTRIIDVLEDEVDEKYYLSEEKTKKLTLDSDLGGKLNMYDYNERDKVHSINKVSPTLNTMQGGDRQPKVAVIGNTSATGHRSQDKHGVIINPLKDKTEHGWHFEQAVYDSQGITRTVKANGGSGNIPKTIDGIRIRKLTPLECWRLQGFSDEQFYKAQNDGVSNSQLYKQAGNSVTVNVVEAITSKLEDEYSTLINEFLGV